MIKNLSLNQLSLLCAAVVLVFSFFLFFYDSGEIFYSLIGAVLSAGLMYISVYITGWLVKALKKQ